MPVRLREIQHAVGHRFERRMPAFGHQHDLGAPPRNRLANQHFALGITFGGIDQVDSGVKRGLDNLVNCLLRDGLVANFGAAQPQRRPLSPSTCYPIPRPRGVSANPTAKKKRKSRTGTPPGSSVSTYVSSA